MLTIPKAETVSREKLARIPITPRGERSERWKGVQHGELANAVVAGATEFGLKVISESWTTAKAGAHLYGKLIVRSSILSLPKGLDAALGVRHANDGAYALQFIAGAEVLACSNGMVATIYTPGMSRRHTKGVVLAETIKLGLQKFVEGIKTVLAKEVKLLQGLTLSDDRANRILIAAGRASLVPWSSVGKVEACWREPKHEDFKPRTAWSLFNAFTEIAKEFPPHRQIRILQDAKSFVCKN